MCILHASSVCSQSVESVPTACWHREQCVCSFRPQDNVRLHLSGKPDPGRPLLTAQDASFLIPKVQGWSSCFCVVPSLVGWRVLCVCSCPCGDQKTTSGRFCSSSTFYLLTETESLT